jgi:membrane protease YdiL (CAAX protease family)
MAVALAVFVARPLLPGGNGGLVGLFVALLVLGAAWPLAGDPRPSARAVAASLATGIGAFGLGRLLGGGHPPVPARPGYVAAVILAAVAEEIFFRRFVYAVLRPGGAAVAVGGSAVLFAIAHVTVYGWWVLALDLAAGLVLGWQRWATGGWAVPAVTHVAANLLVVL